jgi:hypothetical protein
VIELPDPRGREGERGVRWCKPSVGRLEFDPDAITNVDGGCARAATVGEGERDAVTAAVLPVAHSATLEIG